MVWFRRHYDQQVRFLYLPLMLSGSWLLVFLSDLLIVRKVVLAVILALVAALHWDLRDGGLVSTAVYKRGGSYELRNFVTSAVAFCLVTVILAVAQAFYSPLVMMYYLPIVLASLRGGIRMSLALIVGVAGALGSYYVANNILNGVAYGQQAAYLSLFVVLSIASGTIANRLRKSAVDLSALYETGRALGSLLDVKEILDLAMNIVFMDMTPDAAAVFLVDGKTGKCVAEASRGFGSSMIDVDADTDKNMVKAVIAKGEPLLLAEHSRKYRLPFAKDMRSCLCVPIKAADKTLGAFLVCNREPHALGFDNTRFLESLSNQAAIAIQNARLYWQTKEWASLDGMTGVYNYRYFTERLEIEWNRAQRYEKPLSLIMVDVDLFKRVNDTHGHLVGDGVLREIATLLRRHTRETDVVARYGGEEFAIILPETHFKDAYLVADKLRSGVEGENFTGGEQDLSIQLTISLGLSNYPSTSFSRSDLLYQADQALYRAKVKRNTLASSVENLSQFGLNIELEKR